MLAGKQVAIVLDLGSEQVAHLQQKWRVVGDLAQSGHQQQAARLCQGVGNPSGIFCDSGWVSRSVAPNAASGKRRCNFEIRAHTRS